MHPPPPPPFMNVYYKKSATFVLILSQEALKQFASSVMTENNPAKARVPIVSSKKLGQWPVNKAIFVHVYEQT